VIGVERAELVLYEVRVDLDLVHRRGDLRGGEDVAQVVRLEVGDADGLRPAAGVDLLHDGPPLDVVAHRGQRPVDEEQVEVVEAHVRQALVERAQDVIALLPVVVQLAGHEDLAAVQAGLTHRLPDLLLVAVHLRGVDVPVADLQGGPGRLGRVGGLDLEDAEAELRDLDAVVEPDGGHGCHRRSSRSVGAPREAGRVRGLPTGPLPGGGVLNPAGHRHVAAR
jgi:hypothetical protein